MSLEVNRGPWRPARMCLAQEIRRDGICNRSGVWSPRSARARLSGTALVVRFPAQAKRVGMLQVLPGLQNLQKLRGSQPRQAEDRRALLSWAYCLPVHVAPSHWRRSSIEILAM